MAAGLNYDNVWAARGYPVDPIATRQRRGEPEDFHIGGSDLLGTSMQGGRQSQTSPWVMHTQDTGTRTTRGSLRAKTR